MFRKSSLLILFFLCISTLYAEQYKLVRGQVFYKDANGQEVRVFPNQTIPNENVYVRMHEQSKDGDVFVVADTKGKHYTCTAPKAWPGVQLKQCIQEQAQAQSSKTAGYGVTAIRMGEAEEKRAPHFHYLCALVSDFEDAKWQSFPYKSDDTKSIKNAFNTIRSQQQYLSGKQYILSNPLTTRYDVVSRLDSINQQVGEGDLIILYLSSHGEVDADGQFQFIFKDSYIDKQPGKYHNTLSKSEINDYVNQLTAKKARVLFFLDACYAGAVLDNNIHGEAAYYLSTNDQNPAYYNMMVGSPFAIALMEAMTGALNGKDNHCFIDNMVQVGSLGNYLSNAVFTRQQQQRPICNEHAFSPSYVLWRIHSAPTQKVASRIRDLERQANNPKKSDNERATIMLKLGDCYYEGKDTPIDFDLALDYFRQASDLATDKKTKGDAFAKISNCMYYGNPYQDSVEAFDNALEAAKLGNVEAQWRLGIYYFGGIGIPEDYFKAFEWFKRAAEQGHADAQSSLGFCYQAGLGVTRDFSKAVEWFQKAAEQGHAEAQVSLGDCYAGGEGVVKDCSKAIAWYTKAAEQGDHVAMFSLATEYEWGLCVSQDYKQAIKWYTKAEYYYNVGACYKELAEYSKAIEYFEKDIIKNEWNVPMALIGMGDCYLEMHDMAKAYECYLKASEQSDNFFQIIQIGDHYRDTNDTLRAKEFYAKAIKKDDGRALKEIGDRYYEMNDYETAFELYLKSADVADSYALYEMGNKYKTMKDYKMAIKWYTETIKRGDNWAGEALIAGGDCFLEEHDTINAIEWYSKVAEQTGIDDYSLGSVLLDAGDRFKTLKDYETAIKMYKQVTGMNTNWRNLALINIGDCYYDKKDYKNAIKWYKKTDNKKDNIWLDWTLSKLGNSYAEMHDYKNAAKYYYRLAEERGVPWAFAIVGFYYYNGLGVEKDIKHAFELMQQAAEKGYEGATTFLEEHKDELENIEKNNNNL